MSSASASGSSDSRDAVSESVEQLVGECFVKTAHIILSSRVVERIPQTQKDQTTRRKSWFKLNIEEVRSAKPSLDRWRSEGNLGLPLVLEIHLQPADTPTKPSENKDQQPPGTLLERWQINYTPLTTMPLPLGGLSHSQMKRFRPIEVYKRLTLLTRSLYTYVRVLPAYRLYRATSRQHHAPFRLAYRIHSSLVPGEDAANARMHRYSFSPVETAHGQFVLSVDYHPASAVRVLGQAASRLPRAAIISNYVGGGGRGGAAAQETTTSNTPYTGLETAPSAPALLDGTPRRKSWSSSFRLSPARSHESPSPGSSPLLGAGIWAIGGSGGGSGGGTPPTNISTTGASGLPSSLPRAYSTPAKGGRPPLPPLPLPTAAATTAPFTGQRPASMPRTLYIPVNEEIQEEEEEEEEVGGVDQDQDQEQHMYSEEERSVDPEGSSPTDSSGRRLSSPVRIPTTRATQHAQRRRPGLRSSGDIKAMQDAYRQYEKPLSAPALSHMRLPPVKAQGGGGAAGKEGAATSKTQPAQGPASAPGLPPTPLQGTTTTTATEQHSPSASGPSPTDSGASSSVAPQFPTSCSPDFPFAFTPRGNYSISPATSSGARGFTSSVSPSPSPSHLAHQRLRRDSSTASTSSALLAANPPSPVQGREVSASTALLRRASWGARSISGDGSSMANIGNIGYSVSPMHDHTGLDSLLYSTSTPRQQAFMLGNSGLGFNRAGSSPSQGGFLGRDGTPPTARRSEQALLTLPTYRNGSGSRSGSVAAAGAGDELPFAFNAEDLEASRDLGEGKMLNESEYQSSQAAGVAVGASESENRSGSGPAPAPGQQQQEDKTAQGTEPAAAVATLGAFVKLMREAKPLAGMAPVDLESSLAQLERLTANLASRGGS